MRSTHSRTVFTVTTVVVSLILAVLVVGAVSKPDSYLEDADFVGTAADPHSVHRRWKREGGDSGGWKLPGSGWLKKLKKLYSGYEGLPPNLKDAISDGDFSKVTKKDIEDTNVTLLEYIPSKVFEKVDIPVLTAFMDKFIQNGRSNALGRLVESASSKLDTNFLLDKLKDNDGDNTNVTTDILLYSAVSKLGDKGITENIVHTLIKEDLLKSVPEEQLMKVKDVGAAKTLLQNLGLKHNDNVKDIDDSSLLIKLVETGIGPAKNWSRDSLKYLEVMPGAFLKELRPDLVGNSAGQIAKSDLTPLQAKAVTDVYFENHGTIAVNQEGIANNNLLERFTSQLGKLAAFIPPNLTKNPNIIKTIVDSCDKMNLPAPIQSVASFFVDKLKGNKKISDLSFIDFQSIPASVLKNSPPEIISRGISEKSVDNEMLETIGKSAALDEQGATQNSFFQGLIQQLAAYAVQAFSHSGSHVDFSKLPGAFFGALGIKGINNIKGNDIDTAATGMKDNPDALDDVQKALLIKRMKDSGEDDKDLPPELIALMPRKKNERVDPDALDGLPSDSELRLAFGDEHNNRPIRAKQLEDNPHLIGTLTPKQVETIDLEEIPAVLALVRGSRDGPPTPTIKALHARFVEYIRLKTDDYDSADKKLLKHVTAAEVHKLPATVLAYFIDHRQTSKLPLSVKKEILIALGELSPKDHASVPGKTRNEIILQGLDALDEILGKEEKYDVPELAAVGNAVVDLPPSRVARLTPVALEIALQSIQGTAENPERLQQRACLSTEQRNAWRDQIINNYGSPETWSSSTISALCCSLELLNEDDLKKLDKYGISTCNCISDLPPPSHLVELKNSLDRNCEFELGEGYLEGKNAFDRVKADKSLDIEDIESQIIVGRKRRDADKKLNCYALRLTGKLDGYDENALETLDPKEMTDCLYELGVSKLEHEKAKILWKKLVQAYYDSVERIPAESLRLANHVLSGINEGDVNKLNFSDPDVVAYFGRPLGMSKNILRKMAAHLLENKKYPLERFLSTDLMVTRNILCGFEHDKLASIDPNNFREALPILSTIEPTCEQVRLASLANIATSPNVFGPTSTWKAADVRAMGTLLKGFTSEIKNIPPEAFLGLTSTTASSLTDSLKYVTAEQVKFIPSFAAQSISKSQIEEMSEEAQEALEGVQRGPLVSDSAFQTQGQWTMIIFVTITAIANIL